jgi:hypothetical protein
MRRLALASAFALALAAGCAHGDSSEKVTAYCQRWANKFVGLGIHDDPRAYREDLMSTCMAMKGQTYQPQAAMAPTAAVPGRR